MMMAPEKEEETIKKSAEEHRELSGFGGGSLSKGDDGAPGKADHSCRAFPFSSTAGNLFLSGTRPAFVPELAFPLENI